MKKASMIVLPVVLWHGIELTSFRELIADFLLGCKIMNASSEFSKASSRFRKALDLDQLSLML